MSAGSPGSVPTGEGHSCSWGWWLGKLGGGLGLSLDVDSTLGFGTGVRQPCLLSLLHTHGFPCISGACFGPHLPESPQGPRGTSQMGPLSMASITP